MKILPFIELPLLAAIWGASFIFMRLGGPEFGPVLFMALRTGIAMLMLLSFMLVKRQLKLLILHRKHLFVVGIFNTAIPFVLFGWATLTLPAGITAVLNGTTPMFGALVAFIWLKDKLTPSSLAGLIIGFVGVYLLMFDKLVLSQDPVLIPTLAVLLAALCYGFSANYTKKYLTGVPSLALATGSQCSATFLLLPISMFFLPTAMPSAIAIGSVLFIGIVCTGFAYILFFRLIAELGPTKAISVTYLIPAFGIFWGWLFLNETISSWMIGGSCVVLLGVALTTGMLYQVKK